jgi:hypothetical protein
MLTSWCIWKNEIRSVYRNISRGWLNPSHPASTVHYYNFFNVGLQGLCFNCNCNVLQFFQFLILTL